MVYLPYGTVRSCYKRVWYRVQYLVSYSTPALQVVLVENTESRDRWTEKKSCSKTDDRSSWIALTLNCDRKSHLNYPCSCFVCCCCYCCCCSSGCCSCCCRCCLDAPDISTTSQFGTLRVWYTSPFAEAETPACSPSYCCLLLRCRLFSFGRAAEYFHHYCCYCWCPIWPCRVESLLWPSIDQWWTWHVVGPRSCDEWKWHVFRNKKLEYNVSNSLK